MFSLWGRGLRRHVSAPGQSVSQAPWILSSPVEGLRPPPCVAGYGMCSPERRDGRCQPGGCWGLGLWPLREGAYPPSPGVAAVPAVLSVALGPLVLPCALGGSSHPFPMSSSAGRHGETRPATWTYPFPVPGEASIPALAIWGRPVTALTVFFKGLGKAWRQGTGPIGLSSLPNRSVPSLLGRPVGILITFHPAGGAL